MLRHDIDYSLDAALKMAEFEAERGISANYFLFFEENWPFYSHEETREACSELKKLGHRLHQHVDERKVDLQTFYSGPGVVSFHCPTEAVLWRHLPRCNHVYSPYWYGRYFADSGGYFKHGDPEDWANTNRLWQLNLHPEWWFEPEWYVKISRDDHLKYFYCPKTYCWQMFPRGFAETSDEVTKIMFELEGEEIFDVGLQYYGEFFASLEYGYELLHRGMVKLDGKPGKISVVQRYENAVQLKWRYD